MPASILRVMCAVVAGLVLTPQLATTQAVRAPYQIDAIEQTTERDDTVPATRVVVALHWVGLYVTEGPLEPVGVPLAALPGRLDLANYIGSVQLQSSSVPLASLAASDTAVALLWGPWAEAEAQVKVTRWEASTGVFEGEVRSGSTTSPLTAEHCESKPRAWLLEIDCGSFAVLASGDRPLLLSWADYNLPTAEPLARFVYNGSWHYVIRFGAKARDVVGLVSAEPAGWQARFRPRDWALLC